MEAHESPPVLWQHAQYIHSWFIPGCISHSILARSEHVWTCLERNPLKIGWNCRFNLWARQCLWDFRNNSYVTPTPKTSQGVMSKFPSSHHFPLAQLLPLASDIYHLSLAWPTEDPPQVDLISSRTKSLARSRTLRTAASPTLGSDWSVAEVTPVAQGRITRLRPSMKVMRKKKCIKAKVKQNTVYKSGKCAFCDLWLMVGFM